jgi:small subunit ribosomal protein S35
MGYTHLKIILEAVPRKAKKGEHIQNRVERRPSLKDFPKEWLPVPKDNLEPDPVQ